MSFGFSVGDFIAVLALANQLYQNVYKVARKAPRELATLEKDLGAFAQSLNLLVEEIQNPDSLLNHAGPDRFHMVVELKDQALETLLKLQNIANRHGIVKVAGTPTLRKLWDRTRFANDLSKISSLRARLMYHYNVIQLLLTSIGNSSLERLESETKAMAAKTTQMLKLLTELPQKMQTTNTSTSQEFESSNVVEENPNLLLPSPPKYCNVNPVQGPLATGSDMDEHPKGLNQPVLSAISDSIFQSQLSDELMKMAEIHDPWPTIGLGSWIQAGKWWLMKGQSAIRVALAQRRSIECQGYTDLLKASWIIIDVIQEHPQRHFTWSKSDRDTVHIVSEAILMELEKLQKLGCSVPTLEEVLSSDLNIWPRGANTELQIQTRHAKNGPENVWSVSKSPLLFQRFGLFASGSSSPEINSVDCLVLLYYDRHAQYLRLVVQDARGADLLNTIHLDIASHAIFTLSEPRISIPSPEPQLKSDANPYSIYLFGHIDTILLLGLLSSFEAANLFLKNGNLPTETILSYFCLGLLASSRLGCDNQAFTTQVRDLKIPFDPDPHRAKQYWFDGILSVCELPCEDVIGVCESVARMLDEFQPSQSEPNRTSIHASLAKLTSEPNIVRLMIDWNSRKGHRLIDNWCQQWRILTLLLYSTPDSRAIGAHLKRLEQHSVIKFVPVYLDLVCNGHLGSEGRTALLQYLQNTNISRVNHFSRLLPESFCLLCDGVRVSMDTCRIEWVVLLTKTLHGCVIQGRGLLMAPLCVLFRERSFEELEATRVALVTLLEKSTSHPPEPKTFQIALKEILYIYMSAIIGSLPHFIYGAAAWPPYNWERDFAALDRMKPLLGYRELEDEKHLAKRILRRIKKTHREEFNNPT